MCRWGEMFYSAAGNLLNDPSQCRARQQAYKDALRRIGAGEPPESLGLPNVGIPQAPPARAATRTVPGWGGASPLLSPPCEGGPGGWAGELRPSRTMPRFARGTRPTGRLARGSSHSCRVGFAHRHRGRRLASVGKAHPTMAHPAPCQADGGVWRPAPSRGTAETPG